jgi:hypothetical protein
MNRLVLSIELISISESVELGTCKIKKSEVNLVKVAVAADRRLRVRRSSREGERDLSKILVVS